MFYESKTGESHQGDIGVAESTDGGVTFTHLGIALDEPWHLSFPYVFAYNGKVGPGDAYICIPFLVCYVLTAQSWMLGGTKTQAIAHTT